MPDGSWDIDYVAELARVALTPQEKEEFAGQFERILGFFAKLREIDLSEVEAMAHPFPLENVWREDTPGPTYPVEQATAWAPEKKDDQVKVPRVVEE